MQDSKGNEHLVGDNRGFTAPLTAQSQAPWLKSFIGDKLVISKENNEQAYYQMVRAAFEHEESFSYDKHKNDRFEAKVKKLFLNRNIFGDITYDRVYTLLEFTHPVTRNIESICVPQSNAEPLQ